MTIDLDGRLRRLADLHTASDAAFDAETENLLDEELSKKSDAARDVYIAESEQLGRDLADRMIELTDARTARIVGRALSALATSAHRASETSFETLEPDIKLNEPETNKLVESLLNPYEEAWRAHVDSPDDVGMVYFRKSVGAHNQAVGGLVRAVENFGGVSKRRAALVFEEVGAELRRRAMETATKSE